MTAQLTGWFDDDLINSAASTGTTIAPASGAITIAGNVAKMTLILAAVAGSIVINGNAPSVIQKTVLAPSSGTVIISGNTPSLKIKRIPTSGSVVLAGNAPSIAKKLGVSSGAVIKSGNSPTLRMRLGASSGALTITGYAPTITAGGGGTIIAPGTGMIVIQGYAPDIPQVNVVSGFGEAVKRVQRYKDKFALDERTRRDNRDIVAIVEILVKSGLL